MSRDDSVEQIRERVLKDITTLRHQVATTDVEQDQRWFRSLLVGILNCVLTDYENVEIGVERSIYLAAWGRRNLLELKVMTTYVLASEENATAFKNELLIDAKEFYEAITKDHQRTHAEFLAGLEDMVNKESEGSLKAALAAVYRREAEQGPKTDASDAEAAGFKALLAELGLENARPERVGQIVRKKVPDLTAEYEPMFKICSKIVHRTSFSIASTNVEGSLDLTAEYEPMFKICSKIVHRTSFSIASTNVEGSLDELGPFLKTSAFSDVLKVSGSIKDYVNTNGVKPKPNERERAPLET